MTNAQIAAVFEEVENETFTVAGAEPKRCPG